MDRKSIIILAASFLLLWVGSMAVDHIFPPKLVPIPPTNHVALTTNSAVASAPGLRTSPSTTAQTTPVPTGPETRLSFTNARLVVEFTSRGGGIKTIELKDYPAVTRRSMEAAAAPKRRASLNMGAPEPVGAIVGAGGVDGNFVLTRSGDVVRAEQTLPGGVRLVKEFDFGTNYAFAAHDLGEESNNLFSLRVRYENGTDKPAVILPAELVVGTAAPIGPLDDPTTYGTYWYDGSKSQNIKENWFSPRVALFFSGTPRWQYTGGAGNVEWAAVHNQFFTLAAIPTSPAPELTIDKIELPPPDTNGVDSAPKFPLTNGYQASLRYPATNLPAGQTRDISLTFYAGPKEYKTLGKLGQEMGNNLDYIMDFGGPTGFFSKGLLICMNGLHAVGFQYGLCVIVITVIIKMIFWPLTASATRSQKRLQALQPQLKAISEKYKDDPAKKNEKTMEFMKQNNVNPLGSCLPTVLQIPVFFGFYFMLRNAIELRGVHFLWAYDLSQPDTIAYLPGMDFPINPLPLVMGATQFWQMHMTPPSPGMDPGQQKVMKFMPLMMLVFFYRMSAGLTLYWTVSTLLSILQMKLTRTNPATATVAAPVGKKKK